MEDGRGGSIVEADRSPRVGRFGKWADQVPDLSPCLLSNPASGG